MEHTVTDEDWRTLEWEDLDNENDLREVEDLLNGLDQLVDQTDEDQPLSKAESQLISELNKYRSVTPIFQCLVCCEFISSERAFQCHCEQHESSNMETSVQEEYFCALCFTTRDNPRGMAKHHMIKHANLTWTSYMVKTLVIRLSLQNPTTQSECVVFNDNHEKFNVSDFEEFYVTEQDLRAVGLFLEDITSSHSNRPNAQNKIQAENNAKSEKNTKSKSKFIKVVGNPGRHLPSSSPKPKENRIKSKIETKSVSPRDSDKTFSELSTCERERLRRKEERFLFQHLARLFGETYEGSKDFSKFAVLEKARLECFHQLKRSIQLDAQIELQKSTRDALKLSLEALKRQFSLRNDCDVILLDE